MKTFHLCFCTLVCCLVALGACRDETSSDDVYSLDEGCSSESSIRVEDFVPCLMLTINEVVTRCDGAGYGTSTLDAIMTAHYFEAAVNDGFFQYVPTAAPQCLADLAAVYCAPERDYFEYTMGAHLSRSALCRQAIVGQRAVRQSCAYSMECRSGDCGNGSGACGECVATQKEGETCHPIVSSAIYRADCEFGLYCDPETLSCLRLHEAGEACPALTGTDVVVWRNYSCEEPYDCRPDEQGLWACRDPSYHLVGEGEACEWPAVCGPGLECFSGGSAGICKQVQWVLQVGDDCSDTPNRCSSGLYCDWKDTNTCQAEKPAGALCEERYECQDGMLCAGDGICQLLRSTGETCEADEDCASHECDDSLAEPVCLPGSIAEMCGP